ncbi:TetR/AcrR family transcriptional regulator [Paractinoplanes globisporus]|uniref:TetR/AcrR family transcriptional regulator n=1 Tax=Paractinoplanes globisporus TaxID=113565 RepID=A0ABW6WFH6_9ACTN|nr:TetR/AcrR family transcriptional regulator [Actinoplanes globisporus]
MPSRQEQLLDAAITVLGSQGIRQLTHRAVDAAAGLPAGSASNYFRTRDALVNAIIERFAERERASWEALAGMVTPRTPEELAEVLAAYVRRAVGPDRVVTIARYGIFLEAALRPESREQLTASAREIRRWGAEWLRSVGAPDPGQACELLLDQMDGLILHNLAYPDLVVDLEARLTAAVRGVFDVCGAD